MEPILLTIPDVCAALKIGRSTLYEWISAGKVRPVKIGKMTRIKASDLADLVASFEEARDAA
jgi:excisionase family DNA binding protein